MSTRTGAVLAGGSPSSTWTTVGTGSADGVARKAVHRRTRVVAQQTSERDALILLQVVGRQLPGHEPVVDGIVEGPASGLHMSQRGHRRDGLADGSRLKQRVERHEIGATRLLDAVGLGPHQLLLVKHRDADAGDLVQLHPALQRQPQWLGLSRHNGDDLPFSRRDLCGMRGIGEPLGRCLRGAVPRREASRRSTARLSSSNSCARGLLNLRNSVQSAIVRIFSSSAASPSRPSRGSSS